MPRACDKVPHEISEIEHLQWRRRKRAAGTAEIVASVSVVVCSSSVAIIMGPGAREHSTRQAQQHFHAIISPTLMAEARAMYKAILQDCYGVLSAFALIPFATLIDLVVMSSAELSVGSLRAFKCQRIQRSCHDGCTCPWLLGTTDVVVQAYTRGCIPDCCNAACPWRLRQDMRPQGPFAT